MMMLKELILPFKDAADKRFDGVCVKIFIGTRLIKHFVEGKHMLEERKHNKLLGDIKPVLN